MKQVDTEDSFEYWLRKAKVGEKIMYYDGFLMMDRERLIKNGTFVENFPQTVKTAIKAWKRFPATLVSRNQRSVPGRMTAAIST